MAEARTVGELKAFLRECASEMRKHCASIDEALKQRFSNGSALSKESASLREAAENSRAIGQACVDADNVISELQKQCMALTAQLKHARSEAESLRRVVAAKQDRPPHG